MVGFLCMFFPAVISVVITKKLRKENFGNQQCAAYYALFTLFINTVDFLILSFLFDPHWISAPDVFSTRFAAKYALLSSGLAVALAYALEYGRRLVSGRGRGKFLQTGEATIKGFGHVAIRSGNVEESVKFYQDVIGLKEAFRMQNTEGAEIVCMYAAPGQFIEIFPNGGGEQPGDNTIGIKHICIETDNAAELQKELKTRGAPIDKELQTSLSKAIQFWTHDPDGNKIEFMELTPESLYTQANNRIAGEDAEEEEEEPDEE